MVFSAGVLGILTSQLFITDVFLNSSKPKGKVMDSDVISAISPDIKE